MPTPLPKPPLDPLTVVARRQYPGGAMTGVITEGARGDDVVSRIGTAVLSGQQVLGRASQALRGPGREPVPSSEVGRVLVPHRCAAVVAAAVLTFKRRGAAGLEGSLGHRLQSLISRLPRVRSRDKSPSAVTAYLGMPAEVSHDWRAQRRIIADTAGGDGLPGRAGQIIIGTILFGAPLRRNFAVGGAQSQALGFGFSAGVGCSSDDALGPSHPAGLGR